MRCDLGTLGCLPLTLYPVTLCARPAPTLNVFLWRVLSAFHDRVAAEYPQCRK